MRSHSLSVPGGGARQRCGQSAARSDGAGLEEAGERAARQAPSAPGRQRQSARSAPVADRAELVGQVARSVMPPPGQERGAPALGARCRTLYPFSGERHRHGLRFAAGELLTVLQAGPDGGWWEGETAEGLRGWFPASYVQLIEVRPGREAATPGGGGACGGVLGWV